MDKIKNYLKNITFENCIVRLLYSWFAVCSFTLAFSGETDFFSLQYFEDASFPFFVLGVFSLFVLSTLIFTYFESKKTEKLLLLVTYFIYALFCVMQTTDTWFFVGASLVLLAICYYVFSDDKTAPLTGNLPKKGAITVCVICGVVFAGFVGAQTVLRLLTQSAPCFDFGIFAQMYYNMKESLIPYTTCERNFLLSHFAVHVSPIYYLFLPIYALFPDPITLLVCQAIMLASGVIPLYLLCKKIGLSNKATAIFAICYVCYPALAGGCYYDLHENKFLAPLLLWLFYFIENNKWWGCILFSSLTLLVKEDAPIYIIFIAIYMLFSKKDFKKALTMLAIALIYFAAVLSYLDSQGQGVMSNRYDNFIYNDGGLISVVKAVILSPAKAIKEMFEYSVTNSGETPKVVFFIQMLAPLGFLPLLTKKYSRFILLGPFLLVNMMPDYIYQHSVGFQYTYASMIFLMYAAMLNYNDFTPKAKRIGGSFACICAILISTQVAGTRPDYYENYTYSKQYHDEVRQALLDIPEEASVKCSTFYLPICSQREVLYCNDNYETDAHTEYLVLDLRRPKNRTAYDDIYKDNPDWQEVKYIERWLVILQCSDCADGDGCRHLVNAQ